jgi:hypothetical protein
MEDFKTSHRIQDLFNHATIESILLFARPVSYTGQEVAYNDALKTSTTCKGVRAASFKITALYYLSGLSDYISGLYEVPEVK